MQMQSGRHAARKSRSTGLDRRLRIEVIEAAFTRAGLEQDYRRLVEKLGLATLAQTMTERWLHPTIRNRYDREGRSLAVWFSDPHQEHVCEETGEEVVLMKDAVGRVIGFEKLNFSIPETDRLRLAIVLA